MPTYQSKRVGSTGISLSPESLSSHCLHLMLGGLHLMLGGFSPNAGGFLTNLEATSDQLEFTAPGSTLGHTALFISKPS